MMRKRLPAMVLAGGLVFPLPLLAAEGRDDSQAVVLPEMTTRVRLSSTDVNRIVCAEPIRDVVFSQEKGVVVRIAGSNAFVKFTVTRKGSQLVYSETPSEMHVVCGDSIYSLIAVPQRIPARTIQLSTGQKDRVKKNLALFEGLPFEKKVLKFIRDAYAESIPESFLVRTMNRRIELFQDITLTLRREIVVEGEGFRVLEYLAALNPGRKEMRLAEKSFLRKELAENPVAVSIDEPLLRPGETARVFVVEKKPEGEEWKARTVSPAAKETPEKPIRSEEPHHGA